MIIFNDIEKINKYIIEHRNEWYQIWQIIFENLIDEKFDCHITFRNSPSIDPGNVLSRDKIIQFCEKELNSGIKWQLTDIYFAYFTSVKDTTIEAIFRSQFIYNLRDWIDNLSKFFGQNNIKKVKSIEFWSFQPFMIDVFNCLIKGWSIYLGYYLSAIWI